MIQSPIFHSFLKKYLKISKAETDKSLAVRYLLILNDIDIEILHS